MSQELLNRLYTKNNNTKIPKVLKPKHHKQLAPSTISFRLSQTQQIQKPHVDFLPEKNATDTFITEQPNVEIRQNELSNSEEISKNPVISRPVSAVRKSQTIQQPTQRTRQSVLMPFGFKPLSDLPDSRPGSKAAKRKKEEIEPPDVTKNPIFRLKKSNFMVQVPEDFERFKLDPIYSSDISDELWNDPSLIFNYIKLITQKHFTEEFLYFEPTPATDHEPINVYFLRYVPPDKIDKNHYYTLSADGVTSYRGSTSEFVSLQQWVRECSLFLRTRQVGFFSHYSKWRSFSLLKTITSHNNMATARGGVEDRFFNGDPIIRAALFAHQKNCQEILKLSLVDVKSAQTLTLKEFVQLQNDNKERVSRQISNYLNDTATQIITACDITYEQAGGSKSEEETYKANKKEPLLTTKQTKTRKIGANDMMVYTQLATQRFCSKRLSRFLRLCDYILIRTLYQFIVQSAQQLLDFLQPRNGSTGGDNTRLSTQVIIEDNKLMFSPNSKTMIETIDSVWNSLMESVYNIELFSANQSLAQYAKSYPWENPALELTKIVDNDAVYKNLISQFTVRVDNAFKQGDETLLEYTHFLDSYIRNTTQFNIEEILKKDPPASFYDESLKNYGEEVKSMNAIKHSVQVDMLLIQFGPFIDKIKPTPIKCIDLLKRNIPSIAEAKVAQLTSYVDDALATLRKEPTDVHVFVQQFEFRKKISNELKSIQNKSKDYTAFYTLMSENNISTSDEATVVFKELSGLIGQLETVLIQMKDEEDSKIKKWNPAIAQLLQTLRSDLLDLDCKVKREDIMSAESDPVQCIGYVHKLQTILKTMEERAEQVQHYQKVLQLKVSHIDDLQEVTTKINLMALLWESWEKWQKRSDELSKTPFSNKINTDELSEELQNYTKITSQLINGLPDHPLVKIFRHSVQEYNQILPVIIALSNTHLGVTHLNKIRELTGFAFGEQQTYTLQQFFDSNIAQHVETIESISNDASQEASLSTMLAEISSVWDKVEFTMVPHAYIKDFYLVGTLDDVIAQLEESQVLLSTIRSSRYVGAIKGQVDDLSKEMNNMAKCLDLITSFQIAFNSLHKVFKSSDIQRELASEAHELTSLEREYKDWAFRARDSPKPFKLCSSVKAVQQFEGYIDLTNRVQKSLEHFLQKKRTTFPRFYFLSNENLLKIFAESRNPKAVQPFLQKLFEGIQKLEFSQSGQEVTSMTSSEGENIPLVKCKFQIGAIEVGMSSVEKAMYMTMHAAVYDGHKRYDANNRIKWIKNHPAQVVSVVSQVFFSAQVEEALQSKQQAHELQKLQERLEEQLRDLAAFVRTPLEPAMRSGVVALITLDVHSRDIVNELINKKVSSVRDFEWAKRLRYVWDANANRIQIRQGTASIDYGYEYLGATSRLVVTPLTERCYLTLTSAAQYYLGGSPAGPAGTGKTETVKDLSKAVGNFCVVFNCSDAVTVIQMESFFSGLAQSGAWACFDEFNRINSEVLSVIAEQVYAVQAAQAAELQQFEFCGQTIPLNPRAGVFITMNPGYAGRTELPDNLKSLFRPIAMMVPDYAMIAEVVLYSEGFSNAKPLAQKVTQLYNLSSQMLSQQSHYDFGMRALKSVLVMAGASKRRAPELNEDIILIRSMRDSNISKLLVDDARLFDAIIGDLFPGVQFDEEKFDTIKKAIEDTNVKLGYQQSDFLTKKTIQLYQTIFIRHGVMLVGPTGGGKTTSRNLLAGALETLGTRVNQKELNPKAVTLTELYGAYNLSTGDWKNGLVGIMFTQCAEANKEIMQWIIFDGPVDALWIENMNTVLDDNKLLSLANSDRIKMTDQMHILFEVGDLVQASPATVSRCGMVYYQPSDLGWKPLVYAWIEKKPENTRNAIKDLFNLSFDAALNELKEDTIKTIVTPTIWNLAQSVCSLFDAIVESQKVDFSAIKEDSIPSKCAHIFAYSIAWAFSGILSDETRGDFDTFLRELFERKINYPSRRLLIDYSLDANNDSFTPWNDIVTNASSGSSLVPTSDTVRFSTILEMLIKVKRPVLFLGESGCGKTSIIQETLSKNMGEIASIMFTLSARTSAAQIQDLLESKLQSKRKNLYGPPEGKSGVLLIDDFSLPRPDEYWSQPPLEILRQVIVRKGMYNRDELYWVGIENLTVVAASVSQGHVSDRFMSQLTIISLPSPTDTVLIKIFGTILNKFLKDGEFAENVQVMADDVVKTSVNFYKRIRGELLPTPSKAHYTFNLRDVSRVFKGILMSDTSSLSDQLSFTKLWFHETHRVFIDRLVDKADRTLAHQLMFDTAKSYMHLKEDQNYYFGDTPLIWTDILKGYGFEGKASYTEISTKQQVVNALSSFQAVYKTSVVLFDEAIEHVLRLVRVLRQPFGHMLLVGMGGTGKRTVARFAAFVAQIEIFEPQPLKGYDITQFRNDLRGLFRTAGVQNKPIMFLLTDDQIVDESFLEDINNVLNTGEVPGLFESEEYDQMVNDLVPQMKKSGESLAYDSLCRKFSSNIMKNLHVVLALSPVGGRFRDRCRIFPSLVSCCTIDWFDPWPKNSLLNVSKELLGKIELEKFGNVKNKLSEIATFAHELIVQEADKFHSELNRTYYVTPAVFIEFFNLFTTMLQKRSKALNDEKEQLEKGVEKLQETNEKVQEMEANLTKMRPLLQEKAQQTDELLKTLQVDREKVNQAHHVISAEEETVKNAKAEAMKLAADAQADLDEALPYKQAALAAVEDLKNRSRDLANVKTYKTPTQIIVDIMEVVCLLFGKSPDWTSAKQLMAQTNFMNSLMEVHNMPIQESILQKIRSMKADPRFEMKRVTDASESVACIFKWLCGVERYVTEKARIAPKEAKRDAALESLKKAQENLDIKQAQLAEITEKLTVLQKQYDDSRAEQKELQQNIEQCEYRLKNASQLTDALASEKVRWSESLVELSEREKHLLGDTILIALHVAYIGPFSYPYRIEILNAIINKMKELEIQITEPFTLEGVATTQIALREWQIQGLPHDSLSNQNGVLVTQTRRWPLLIDPQGQGRKWIIGRGNVKIIRTTDTTNYATIIENAVRLGSNVLVEDVQEQIDAGLGFIINPVFKKQGGRLALRIGDKWVDYDPNFKLFLTTKLSNPHFLPDVFIQLSVINFSVTLEGLEEQLLGDVVLHEMPELEKQRSELIVAIANDQKQLQSLMQQILHLLFTSTGNILDNEVLINTLHEAKDTSIQVSARLVEAEKTEKTITEQREVYRPVAKRGSILYFVILELPGIDSMYQYSLEFFKRIFKSVLDSAESTDSVEQKLKYFISQITYSSFCNVSRGLFSAHRLVFSFLIATALLKSTENITEDEWRIFLRGPPSVSTDIFPHPPDQINSRVWANICALSQTDALFSDLPRMISSNYSLWGGFLEEDQLFAPSPYDNLSHFKRIILAQNLCNRKVSALARMLVSETLGEKFVSQEMSDLSAPFKDTSNDTPLLFILSQGADPRDSLERLAKDMDMSSKLSILSLGQGRDVTATNLVQNAKISGNWVYLQNCHLCPSFLPSLEQMVQEMSRTASKFNQQFRLILSSMPTNVFPISVLRNSVKVTSEPPRGIKSNTANLLSILSKDEFEKCKKPEPWHKLLYSLALFHSTIQERKQYGPLGFNKIYEWSTSDFLIGSKMLKSFIQNYEQIPWGALTSMIGEVVYGGRVTDDWDRRCMNSMLDKFVNERSLEDGTKFDPMGNYKMPPYGSQQQTIEFIKTYPDIDQPDIFGLHSSAQHALEDSQSSALINLVVSVQPKDAGGASASKDDEIVLNLADDFDQKLPAEISTKNMDESLTQENENENEKPNSLTVVLLQEVERFNTLLSIIHNSLKMVSKAIKGQVVMSVDIAATYHSLLDGKVPKEWSSKAYPSTKPLNSWFKDLLQKVEFIQRWVQKGQPAVFWFPGFFFPQSFLTAVLQSHSRKHSVPIDRLSFEACISEKDEDHITGGPEDGVFISGLFFDGCKWDEFGQTLVDVNPSTQYSKCPVLHLIPKENFTPPSTDYICPVYRTSERAGVLSTTGHSTNFVVSLGIPSAVSPDKWTLRGAALLTGTPF